MEDLICYKTFPEWNIDNFPKIFRNKHNTKVGTWAKLEILSGSLRYDSLDNSGNIIKSMIFDQTSDIPFVEPQAWHRVEPISKDLRCRLSFYCLRTDYKKRKY